MRGLLRRGVPAVEGGLFARKRGDADAHAAGDADADAVRPHSDAHTLLDANTDADLDVHADTDQLEPRCPPRSGEPEPAADLECRGLAVADCLQRRVL